jgi:AraC-like DNA-binding protein
MDALSQALRVVHLDGAIFTQGRFTAPWSYHTPRTDFAAAPPLEGGAQRVMIFHLIAEGQCFVEMGGQPPVRLHAGEVVVFPHGDAHLMTSTPGLPPPPDGPLLVLTHSPRHVDYGGGGAATRLVCGYLACDAALARLLFAGLPPLLRVDVRGSNVGHWLEASVEHALDEALAPRPGSPGMQARLAEVLFMEVLRLYMAEQEPGRTGWLAGMADRIVGGALNALHTQPAHAWTVDELARAANTSRSVLSKRFQQFVGSSPMRYLARWRMLLAANLLARGNASLARIAEEVGYQTDMAFSRAFRREHGTPPAAWRRRRTPRANGAGQTPG